jgi:tRNA dimethylallyltransferase
MKPRIIFLVGPTAVGKTELALKLARKLNAEIISCDSMQVYKGMEILSSQPAKRELKTIRHHLLGQISPIEQFNVSKYRSLALHKIREIIKRGKLPLFVGGSGLYMSVVIDGIFKIKAEDKEIRNKLYRKADRSGSSSLHQELIKVDPKAAVKIHPNDTKRIVRALEVFKVTGKPISELQATRIGLQNRYEIEIYGLALPREELDRKIDKRVEKMFRQGLVREVKKLLKRKLSQTSRFAIGIKEVKGYLDGEYSLDEAKELIQKNTRHYARRQMTWFRKDERIKWIRSRGTVPPELLEFVRDKRKRS